MLCKKTYLLILPPVGYVFSILFATLKAVRETSQRMGNSLWSSAACLAESGYLLPADSLSLWCQSWLGSAGFPRVLTIRNLVSLSLCMWEVGTWCREEMLLGVNPCFRGRRERRGERREGEGGGGERKGCPISEVGCWQTLGALRPLVAIFRLAQGGWLRINTSSQTHFM